MGMNYNMLPLIIVLAFIFMYSSRVTVGFWAGIIELVHL